MQADQEKLLPGVGLLRCVENLRDGLLDALIVLVVVAEIVEELAGENGAEHSHGIPLRGTVLCGQPHPPQPLCGRALKGTVGSLIFVHVVTPSRV